MNSIKTYLISLVLFLISLTANALTQDIPVDLKVWCHEQQLRLVLTHILRNAIDAFETKADKDRESITIIASEERIDRRPFTRISISQLSISRFLIS